MTTYALPDTESDHAEPATTPLVLVAVAGPLLFLAGQALLPSLPMDSDRAIQLMVEHREQLVAARLLTAAGAFLLALAAVHYGRLALAGRGHRLLAVGATVFGIASFFNAVSQVVSGYATWTATAPAVAPASGRYIIEHIESGLIAAPLGFWSIPALAVGALLMAVGLWRSGRVPTWLPVLLAVGTVMAAGFAGVGYLVALTQAPFTIALVTMAVLARRRSDR